FYHATTMFESLRAFMEAKKTEKALVITDPTRTNLGMDVVDLIEQLDILNVRVSRMAANELQYELRDGSVTWGRFGDCVRELNSTLSRELSLTKLFAIEADKQRYLETSKPLFGKEFGE